MKEIDLLYACEVVVEKAHKSKFSDEFFDSVKTELDYLSMRLNLSKEEAALMAIFMEFSNKRSIYVSAIADFLGCTRLYSLRLLKFADLLVEREFVRRVVDDDELYFFVDFDVVEAFKDNECYQPKVLSGLSPKVFFDELKKYFDYRDRKIFNTDILYKKVRALIEANQQLEFSRKIISFDFDRDDELLLIAFCVLFVKNHDDVVGFHNVAYIYDDEDDWKLIKSQMSNASHILMRSNFVEFNNEYGFVNRESFRLSIETKKLLLSELDISLISRRVSKKDGMIYYADIKEKELYFDDEIAAHFDDIKGLLSNENYNDVKSRLKEAGMPAGLTFLFYGAPGTGKTELALQLARKTMRDVYQVDFASLKSKWVGESEKNVKGLFDTYREMVREAKQTPILLFNEADSIIGKRNESADYSVDKMENTIQNIILQEMEQFDGILIATSNLIQNFDKAFERRFLYKFKFPSPDMPTRVKIWKSQLPDLDDESIALLAERYDFTGGQINNVARHYVIDSILHKNEKFSIDRLKYYCDTECFETRDGRKIGFVR